MPESHESHALFGGGEPCLAPTQGGYRAGVFSMGTGMRLSHVRRRIALANIRCSPFRAILRCGASHSRRPLRSARRKSVRRHGCKAPSSTCPARDSGETEGSGVPLAGPSRNGAGGGRAARGLPRGSGDIGPMIRGLAEVGGCRTGDDANSGRWLQGSCVP
jgi:hypothetical protein